MREKLLTLPLAELRKIAKEQGLKAVSGYRKSELVDKLCELAGVSGEQALTALPAFRETGLLTWRYEPFEARLVLPARKCSMNDSPLIRYLRENAGHDGK